MTLHEAIIKLLAQTGQAMTTLQIADNLNKKGWYKKGDGSSIEASQIDLRTRKYSKLFNRNGKFVSLSKGQKAKQPTSTLRQDDKPKQITSRADKDESYIIGLCDKVLGLTSSKQHKFDFLLGDPNSIGKATKLPVDSFYETLNLVIEYRERQHTEGVNFFDKPNKMTVSGVHRGEQRRIYDERRREVLPRHKIKLVEISYTDFNYDRQKRIIRNPKQDEEVVRQILKKFIK